MKEFWDRLRRKGLNPQPIQHEGAKIPQFQDPDRGLSLLETKTAEDLIDRWLEEHEREFKYAYYVRVLAEGEEGLAAGIYCNTNIYPSEWEQSPMLRHAYSSIYTTGLAQNGYIRSGQYAHLGISPYFLGEEGYALLQAIIMGLPNS